LAETDDSAKIKPNVKGVGQKVSDPPEFGMTNLKEVTSAA